MDPTVLFALACFTMPAARIGDPSALLQLLCEPSIWIGVVATLALVWFARSGEQVGLEVWEVRAATWYLLNGLVFHYIFDYCIPVLNAVPTIRSMYQEMDLRYGCLPGLLPCPGAPPGGGGGDKPMDASVWVLCHIECFVDAPICLLVFAAYLRGWSIRKPLELLLAGLQIAGTFVFQGTELYAGLRHTPPPPHNVGGPRGVLQNLILDPFSNTAGFEAQFLFFWCPLPLQSKNAFTHFAFLPLCTP